MFLLNGKKINIDAPFTTSEGVTYPHLRDSDIRNLMGVIEQPDPVWPDPAEEYLVTENEDGTLNIVPKSPEQVAEVRLRKAKALRQQEVSRLTVTTQVGNTYDADKDSQIMMGAYLAAMDVGDVIPWVLASNTPVQINRAELKEALRLAGAAMAVLWVKPYEVQP